MKRASVVSTLTSIILLGSCSDDGGGNGESFTNGGMTLTATTSSDSTNKTVTVTGAGDTEVLTLVVSKTGATLSAPGETDISMSFYSAQEELPTDYAANRMAVYVAGIRALNSGTSAMPDSPGCDWFWDSQCTLDCCAKHDQCYRENSCGASSWVWAFDAFACGRCNTIVYNCILAACAGVIESGLPNNCYDAECDKHYDCPPDFDNCTCRDICADSGLTIPATCGDGQCAADENTINCWNDCAFSRPKPTCQGTVWSPPGDACGVTCPTTMQTPAGTWNDCLGANSRPGCPAAPPMALLDHKKLGYVVQSCRIWSPTYDSNTAGNFDKLSAKTVTHNAYWFDIGRPRPTLPVADWKASVDKLCTYDDIDKKGGRSIMLYSSTHWAAVCCQFPLAFGTSFPDTEAKAMLEQIEALAWPR